MQEDDEEILTAQAVELVLKEFAGDHRPATVEMLAKLYSTMFAQYDATIAMFGLVMKNSPHLMFEDDFVKIRRELGRSADLLADSLKEMSESRNQGDE